MYFGRSGTAVHRQIDPQAYAPTSNQNAVTIAGRLLPSVFALAALMGTAPYVATVREVDSTHAPAPLVMDPWADPAYSTTDYPAPDQDQTERLSATAIAVRFAHDSSGLSWSEMARALGVSRRSVYNWATGASISVEHAKDLAAFSDLVRRTDAGDPKNTRALLLAPQAEGGGSLYEKFTQRRAAPSKLIEGLPQSRLLVSHPDGPDVSGSLIDVEPI